MYFLLSPARVRTSRPPSVGLALALAASFLTSAALPGQSEVVQFVFTSDAHYGLTRMRFRGRLNVDAHTVNAAMIAKINTLPGSSFPKDGGLRAGETIGAVDFVAEGGDVANRRR